MNEQGLDMACKHPQHKQEHWGVGIDWCPVCGAIKTPEDDNWTFPESHMLVLNLISGATMAAASMLENETLPNKGLEELLEILTREDVYGRDIVQMKNTEFLKHFQKYAEASGTPGVCDVRRAWFTQDVSVEDLRAGERSPLRPLFDVIAAEWCGSDHSRAQHPRCGTVYAYNSPVDGNGRVELSLRFPFRDAEQPDDADKYKRVGEALAQPLKDRFDACAEEYAAKQKLMASNRLKISEVDILLHTLGHPTYYRNYFAASPGSWDWSGIQVLIHTGFMEEYKSQDHDSGMEYFRVTELGKQRMRDAGFAVPRLKCRKKKGSDE